MAWGKWIEAAAIVWLLGALVIMGQTTLSLQPRVEVGAGLVETKFGRSATVIEVDQALMLHRVPAPDKPGTCEPHGSGAIAMDAAGFLYLCDGAHKWRRTAQPLAETW